MAIKKLDVVEARAACDAVLQSAQEAAVECGRDCGAARAPVEAAVAPVVAPGLRQTPALALRSHLTPACDDPGTRGAQGWRGGASPRALRRSQPASARTHAGAPSRSPRPFAAPSACTRCSHGRCVAWRCRSSGANRGPGSARLSSRASASWRAYGLSARREAVRRVWSSDPHLQRGHRPAASLAGAERRSRRRPGLHTPQLTRELPRCWPAHTRSLTDGAQGGGGGRGGRGLGGAAADGP